MKHLLKSAAAAATVAGALVLPASGASAAPVITGGLVNVTIVDAVDISRVTVQLPIAVAANVCDVDINVLAAQQGSPGGAQCEARADSRANNR